MTKIPPAESADNQFKTLAALDVGDKIEKKGQLSYLSWAWAVDVLLRHDPKANWEYHEPQSFGQTMMVFCSVSAFNKTMTAQLPVMDNKNKAISNPDAFAVNTAMQRCLVKAIALHGLGLYIYAGEDLPADENGETAEASKAENKQSAPKQLPPIETRIFDKMMADLKAAKDKNSLDEAWSKIKAWRVSQEEKRTALATEEQAAMLLAEHANAYTRIMTDLDDEIPF